MATFTVNTQGVQLNSSVDPVKLTSVNATLSLPVANATAPFPKFLGAADGTGALTFISAGGAGSEYSQYAEYRDIISGSFSTTVAAMAPTMAAPITAKITLIGSGGGGCAVFNPTLHTGCGGGGSGAVATKIFNELTPETSFFISNGAGGAGGSNSTTFGHGLNGNRSTMTITGSDADGNYAVAGGGGAMGATSLSDIRAIEGGLGGSRDPIPGYLPWDLISDGNNGGNGMAVTSAVGAATTPGAGGISIYTNLSATFPAYSSSISGDDGYILGSGGNGAVQLAATSTAVTGGRGAPGAFLIELWGATA